MAPSRVRNAGVGRHAFGNMSTGISSKVKTSKPAEQDLSLAIPHLKSKWMQLPSADRARAVAAIRRTGVSIRQIARDLEVSESNLRHLLKTLNAPPDDQALARQGKISTNELVRRGQATKRQLAVQKRELLEIKRTRSAQKGADQICKWILEEQICHPDGEWIIEEVRREFADRELDGSLSSFPTNAPLPLPELIGRCKPKRPHDGSASSNSWYAEWLCRWTFFAFRDSIVRDNALELALEQQWKR